MSPGSIMIFDSLPTGYVLSPTISEISGIADSKVNPGYVWGQEDSGNPPQLYLIQHNGVVQKRVYLKGVTNRDWEDMALAGNDIYIAETGDNGRVYSEYCFYRFPEPSASTDTVNTIEKIRFVYEDGAHDAESFLVDPVSKDIYIFTKRDNPSLLFKLDYPYSLTDVNTARKVGSLPYTSIVSADITDDGKEVLVKNYSAIYYYKRVANETIEQALAKPYSTLSYKVEPQGEAISFAQDGSGFFTISEKAFWNNVQLYFYKRK